MKDERLELVRIDATGTAHPVGKTASRRMRAAQGTFRLLPSPEHLVVLRLVGEDGRRDEHDGPIFRLAGEITTPGALCDIVSLIGQAGWRGELVVFGDGASRSIFFDHSSILAASSSVEGERLGEVLYRYGALDQAQIKAAAANVTSEVRFGEAAVKAGFLTVERLYQLMTKQAEEIVYAALRVGDGAFYFLDSFDEGRLATRLNLAAHAALMEGVRRMDETRYFRDRIPSDQHVPARVPGREAPGEEFEKVFDAVDGARSIAAICRAVGQGEFEVTQALFQLVQSGHVVIHAPKPTGPAAILALFNQAIALILAESDGVGHGGEVREQLASFATGAGIYDALFAGAGPARDGRLDVERVVANITMTVGADQAEAMLAQWLYEYVSFALFVAEPYLRSAKAGESAHGTPLARKVAELIAPLAPKK